MQLRQLFLLGGLAASAPASPLVKITDSAEIKKLLDDGRFQHSPMTSLVGLEKLFPQVQAEWKNIKSVSDAHGWLNAPPPDKGIFSSGVSRNASREVMKNLMCQDIEMSLEEEILIAGLKNLPDTKTWTYLYQAYAEKLANSSSEVTLLLPAPRKKLNGPSDPFQDGRLVRMSPLGKAIHTLTKNNVTINVVHVDVPGIAGRISYEIWPLERAYNWQAMYNITGSTFSSTQPADTKPTTWIRPWTKASALKRWYKSGWGKESTSKPETDGPISAFDSEEL